MVTASARTIENYGSYGLYIDIESDPYKQLSHVPDWGRYAYTKSGCAWFASSRAKELTGKNITTIYSGWKWYNETYSLFGFEIGGTPRNKSLACWSNHVAVVERVEGNNVIFSEGGYGSGSSNSGYCRIGYKTISDFEAASPESGYFLGYVYLHKFDVTSIDKYVETIEPHVYVREGPGKKYKDNVTFIETKGTVKHIKGYATNEYGHIWYQLDNGKFVYEKRVKPATEYKISYKPNASAFGAKDKDVKNMPATGIKIKSVDTKFTTQEPTLAGYTFLGWSTYASAKTPNRAPGEVYSDNQKITLHAVWEKQTTTMKLSAGSGSEGVNLNLKTNNTTTLTANYTDGYKPNGGKLVATSNNDKATVTKENTISGNAAAYTITAQKPGQAKITLKTYDANGGLRRTDTQTVNVSTFYDISFNANGGANAPAQQQKTYKVALTLQNAVPTKDGCVFMGWSTSPTATVATYGPGDLFYTDNNVTLYAVWNASYNITEKWSDDGKTLTLIGNGNMANYASTSVPWRDKRSQIEKVVISDGITSIGSYAFADCINLKQVDIPQTVRLIGSYAFYNCKSLSTANVSDAWCIGNKAFAYCNSMKTVKWNSKTFNESSEAGYNKITLGAFAFEGCTILESVELPGELNSIGAGAFANCSSIEIVEIPDTVSEISDSAFNNCTALNSVSLPKGITVIEDGVFSGCSAMESIVIPESVTEIGDQAFAGCSAVESVVIPDTVETLGSGVFSNCISLSDVTLPETIDVIGSSMFSGCTALTSVELPETVTNIGDGTFMGCTSLNSIEIPENVSVVGNMTFANCTLLSEIIITDGIWKVDQSAFYGCTSLKDVTISATVEEIGDFAFAGCTSLKEIELPNTVTTLGAGAFMDCTALKSVAMSEGIEEIDDYTFSGCSALANINMPTELSTVGEGAFAGCSSLKNLEIPRNATNVSANAFSDCASLTVTCYSVSGAKEDIENSGIPHNVIVPVGSVEISKPDNTTINYGETLKLSASVYPENATNKNVQWVSDVEEIATVSPDGTVTATGSGFVNIYAITEDGAFEAVQEIYCYVPATSIKIESNIKGIFEGSYLYLDAITVPTTPTNIDFVWSSSDETVATVDELGCVSAISQGNATITVSTENGKVYDTYDVNVKKYIPVTNITVDTSDIPLYIGESKALMAVVEPSNATNCYVNWYSTNESVATVDTNGKITAVGEGSAQIIVYSIDLDEGKIINITVNRKPVLDINKTSTNVINYGDTLVLRADFFDLPEGATVEWFVEGNGVSTRVEEDGAVCKVTSISNGNAKILLKAIDANGEVITDVDGNEFFDEITISSKAGFFQKFISFFKNLFGLNRLVY